MMSLTFNPSVGSTSSSYTPRVTSAWLGVIKPCPAYRRRQCRPVQLAEPSPSGLPRYLVLWHLHQSKKDASGPVAMVEPGIQPPLIWSDQGSRRRNESSVHIWSKFVQSGSDNKPEFLPLIPHIFYEIVGRRRNVLWLDTDRYGRSWWRKYLLD